jgi:hypothetical protein
LPLNAIEHRGNVCSRLVQIGAGVNGSNCADSYRSFVSQKRRSGSEALLGMQMFSMAMMACNLLLWAT